MMIKTRQWLGLSGLVLCAAAKAGNLSGSESAPDYAEIKVSGIDLCSDYRCQEKVYSLPMRQDLVLTAKKDNKTGKLSIHQTKLVLDDNPSIPDAFVPMAIRVNMQREVKMKASSSADRLGFECVTQNQALNACTSKQGKHSCHVYQYQKKLKAQVQSLSIPDPMSAPTMGVSWIGVPEYYPNPDQSGTQFAKIEEPELGDEKAMSKFIKSKQKLAQAWIVSLAKSPKNSGLVKKMQSNYDRINHYDDLCTLTTSDGQLVFSDDDLSVLGLRRFRSAYAPADQKAKFVEGHCFTHDGQSYLVAKDADGNPGLKQPGLEEYMRSGMMMEDLDTQPVPLPIPDAGSPSLKELVPGTVSAIYPISSDKQKSWSGLGQLSFTIDVANLGRLASFVKEVKDNGQKVCTLYATPPKLKFSLN